MWIWMELVGYTGISIGTYFMKNRVGSLRDECWYRSGLWAIGVMKRVF
jgi:hypothetical protein